jgi:hypothetical protein
MPSNSKQPKKPTLSTPFAELPSDGWPELITFLPNRLVQIYCHVRKIDKISNAETAVIIVIAFALLLALFVLSQVVYSFKP